VSLRVLRTLLIIGMIIAGYVAYDQYSRREAILAETATLLQQLAGTRNELGKLEKASPKNLRPPDEAIENLVGRLIDDTELLGSSVRMETGQQARQWETIGHGVTKTQMSFITQAEKQAGLGYFALVWQILMRQPVRVIEAQIDPSSDVVKFSMTVELLALEGG
jgi:hypothetical protein